MQFDELMYEAGLLYARLDPRHQPKALELVEQLEQEGQELDRKAQKLIVWLEARITEGGGEGPA